MSKIRVIKVNPFTFDREAITEALTRLEGWTITGTTPEVLAPPCAYLGPARWEMDGQTFNAARITYPLTLVTPYTDVDQAVKTLEEATFKAYRVLTDTGVASVESADAPFMLQETQAIWAAQTLTITSITPLEEQEKISW